MKKSVVLSLAALASLSLLTGCQKEKEESSLPAATTSQAAATTFAEQLKNAGISFTYVDPNPGFAKTEGANPSAEVTTGGSNTPYYKAASITSFDELVYRASLQFKEYYWSKVKDGSVNAGGTDSAGAHNAAKDLSYAAQLENAKYVQALFPNDGSYYEIKVNANAIGERIFATADSQGTPNIAIFGTAIKKDATGATPIYYIDASYLTAGITTTNLLNTGRGELLYYEYNYTSMGTDGKMGPSKRNYGCRVDFEVDFTKTSLINKDYSKTAVSVKGNAPAIESYSALSTRLVLTTLKTIG